MNPDNPPSSVPAQPDGILMVGLFFAAQVGNWGDCLEISSYLAKQGFQVITTSHYQTRVHRLLDMLQTALLKRHNYRVAQVDVYSGAAFIWAEAVCLLLRRLGKPYVLTLHGGNLPDFARKHPRRVAGLLQKAAQITAPSSYLLSQMQPYANSIRFLPSPVRLEHYQFLPRTKPGPRLVWLRTFAALYNPLLALETVQQLRSEFPDIHLSMIGPETDDGTFQSFIARLEQLKFADCVTLVGRIPKVDVPRYLQQGDIFINTTNVDNTPISVIEALACGLCVVSTNVGGIPYLLQHEHDALLVPPDDPQAMADAVRRILTEPGLAERLSRNARATAEQYDWSAVLPQWKALLTQLLQPEPAV